MTALAIEVAHYSALVPLAYLLAFRRDARTAYWIVAIAFSVSWFADLAASFLGGSWAPAAAYPVVQFGLVALAFGGYVWGVVVAAVLTTTVTEIPPALPYALGSMAAMWLARNHALVAPVLVYFGLGTALYLGMVRHATPADYEAFMRFWWPYQGARLTAFGLFIRAAAKET